MDEYDDPFANSTPPRWSRLVQCGVCGETYGSHELTYETDIERWVCRNQRQQQNQCPGTELDIVVLDKAGSDEEQGQKC
jgi:hypothetical protein